MARPTLHRLALLALMTSPACSPDDWRYRPYPDAPAPRDASDVTDARDVADVPDVADVTDVIDASADVVDASVDVTRDASLTVRAGITTLGPVRAGSLRVTHSLGALSRTCTPDRSLCVTGGIAP